MTGEEREFRFIEIPPRAVDHTGRRVGRVVALGPIERKKYGKFHSIIWLCKCDCGNLTRAQSNHLAKGKHRSCGCWRLERASEANLVHGASGTPEWHTWRGLKQRCMNRSHKAYHRYGGRGISVCLRWVDSFENFLADMGKKPSHAHELDRIDNDGPYSQENCRWVLRSVNNRNRSTTRMLTVAGRTRKVLEWAEDLGISCNTLRARLDDGWSPEDAVSVPLRSVSDTNRKGSTHYSKRA